MSIIVNITSTLVGVFMMIQTLSAVRLKKMSAGESLWWIAAAFIIIILSIFPGILGFIANLLGIWWAPSIVLFIAVVLLTFIAFDHTREISVMQAKLTELSEQVAVMKHELKERQLTTHGEREEQSDNQ